MRLSAYSFSQTLVPLLIFHIESKCELHKFDKYLVFREGNLGRPYLFYIILY